MRSEIDKYGISEATRRYWSGGQPETTTKRPAPGFHVGIVMDDNDYQYMGRLWVYFPNFSSMRFDPDSQPTGGTAPDKLGDYKDQNLTEKRLGWFICYPLFPIAGSDDFRTAGSVTGGVGNNRTSNLATNSYGFWYQPRIGDTVGVLFNNDNIAEGYWIGCIPKHLKNFSVPGNAGRGANSFSSGYHVPDGGIIPSFEKLAVQDPNIPLEEYVPQATFLANLQSAGTIKDILRGAGNSSPQRESPSYVMGLKSPGWSYKSEQNNHNEDGTKFSQKAAKYQSFDTTGHQLVFDDHPDYQGVRLRTSYGSQIYFCDTTDNPFIYISTAKGNVWMEMVDSGNINVYGKGSFSLNAEIDINLTAGNNINLEAMNDMNILVRKNQRMKVSGEADWSIGDGAYGGGQQDLKLLVNGNKYENVHGVSTERIVGDYNGYFTKKYSVAAADNISFNSATNVGIQAVQNLALRGDGAVGITSSGNIVEQAAIIIQNDASAVQPTIVNNASQVSDTVGISVPLPIYNALIDVSMAPTDDQISTGTDPSDTVSQLSPIVPRHQPWPSRTGKNRGFNGYVVFNKDFVASLRRGATSANATKPDDFIGHLNGSSLVTDCAGNAFSTNSPAEAPTYNSTTTDSSGFQSASAFSTSDAMKNYIKGKETFSSSPYTDAGGKWAIGYGHNINIGDTINGQTVDKTFIDNLNRTGGQSLQIDQSEADRLFDTDLPTYENAVRNNVTTTIDQGQFDAMVSLAYNVGPGAFANSQTLKEINSNNFQNVPNQWMGFNIVNGKPNDGLTARRREELNFFNS